mgnify:CR=1 FL=1
MLAPKQVAKQEAKHGEKCERKLHGECHDIVLLLALIMCEMVSIFSGNIILARAIVVVLLQLHHQTSIGAVFHQNPGRLYGAR